ncbi:MAG: hypothetical protein JW953_17300 [Anaerolineae bacterium]|nr:hypothetical protein [Anaerolineae bacterium]
METLNILICSSNERNEQQMARPLIEAGMQVETSDKLIHGLYSSQQLWDFLLIDLEGLDSYLRLILPAVRRKYPNLPVIGIRGKSVGQFSGLGLGYELELDAYLSDIPQPEELIINFPQAATKYQSAPAGLAI